MAMFVKLNILYILYFYYLRVIPTLYIYNITKRRKTFKVISYCCTKNNRLVCCAIYLITKRRLSGSSTRMKEAGKGKGLLRNWESGEKEIFVKIKATIGTLLADLFGDQSDQAALLQHQALAQHKEYSTILFLLRTHLFVH